MRWASLCVGSGVKRKEGEWLGGGRCGGVVEEPGKRWLDERGTRE